jgi:hypothetical protein
MLLRVKEGILPKPLSPSRDIGFGSAMHASAMSRSSKPTIPLFAAISSPEVGVIVGMIGQKDPFTTVDDFMTNQDPEHGPMHQGGDK